MTINKVIEEIQDQYLMACSKRKNSDNKVYLSPSILLYEINPEPYHALRQVYDYLWFDDDKNSPKLG